MNSEFAYSRAMQIVLAAMTLAFTFTFIYLIATLILEIFDEKASRRQKAVFAFLVGGLLNTIWAYAVYFIGGMREFSATVYALVVNPNPVFALLYFIIGVKVLKIPPVRSVKLMGHVYLYYVTVQIFNRILNTVFFIQAGGRYNYLLDAVCQLALFCVILLIYSVTKYLIRRYNYSINLNVFINFKRELAFYLIRAAFIYLMIVGLPRFVTSEIVANMVILSIIILIFTATNLWELYCSAKNEIGYRDEYIRVLTEKNAGSGMEETCLQGKMNENPSLISILIGKRDYAKKMNVKLKIKLQSSTSDFYIDNTDICRIIDCLLENAIRSAAASNQRRVSLTVDTAACGEKLVIINNSADLEGAAGRKAFHGAAFGHESRCGGLATVRKIVSRHGNCVIKTSRHGCEVSTYLETKARTRDFAL